MEGQADRRLQALAPTPGPELGRALFVGTEREWRELRAAAGPGPWTIDWTPTGDAALAKVEGHGADMLIVSSASLASAGRLLATARRQWPLVSLVSIGAPPEDAPAVDVLEWPAEADRIVGLLFGLAASRGILHRNAAAWLAERVDALPGLPKVWEELTAYLEEPERSAGGAARIVTGDIALSAQILRMANSPWAGVGRHISSVEQAVAMVGLNNLRGLVYAASLATLFEQASGAGISLEQFSAHGMATASMARRIAAGQPWAEEAFTAALVADVGELALAQHVPGQVRVLRQEAARDDRSMRELEARLIGFTHAEVSAELLGQWGLSPLVIDAVAHHHDAAPPADHLDVACTIGLARQIVACAGGRLGELEPVDPLRLAAWAAHLHLDDEVAAWSGDLVERLVHAG